jgi:peptidoglycan hydrolase FlgJ
MATAIPAQGPVGTGSLGALKLAATTDPKAAVREAAKQFESIFMQELMKSMRESTMSTGMFENQGSKMGSEMLDQQYASQMTGLRGGLSDIIARQLERQMGEPLANMASDAAKAAAKNGTPEGNLVRHNDGIAVKDRNAGLPLGGTDNGSKPVPSGKERQVEFLREHSDAAKAAEKATGIPASFMVAQAAHETGWGRREIKNADGSDSNNLFGIKAGPNWKGPVAEVTTTEYINGQPHKVTAKFRAYASAEESFKDYANLMKDSPRYAKVVANADTAQGFAHGLQKAGYATDPAYASKLTKMINTTLKLQRAYV